MAANDTSEEKSLPASQKKLRELRRKGNIARSMDIVSAVAFSLGAIYVFATISTLFDKLKLVLTNKDIFNDDGGVFSVAQILAKAIFYGAGATVLLLAIIVLSGVVIVNIIVNKGFIFAIDKIAFDFNKLNAVEGIRRMFSLKSIIELAKVLVKLAVFAPAVALAIRANISAPFVIPECGLACFDLALYHFIFTILSISILMLLFFGFADVFLQRWLFLREQRMTKTEAKKDHKDQEGSPEIKSQRRRTRNQLLQRAAPAAGATIFIEGNSMAVGMRFVRRETQLPFVVSKGAGAQAERMIAEAVAEEILVHFNDELATVLFRRLDIGAPLPEEYFDGFIQALKAVGQI